MKNITVAVPDEVYRTARVRAAERGRSVSALVADYLGSLSAADDHVATLEEQQRALQRGIKKFRAGNRLDRDQVHDRAVR